ncbi:MAG: endopeptidase La [Armatimonadetes bacterium]|nr:endopeptidase La [Armatimonadota bacterium]
MAERGLLHVSEKIETGVAEPENEPAEETPRPEILPLLPIRDTVYFPHNVIPLFVGRDKSLRALEEARSQDRYILLVAQKQLSVEDPQPEDIYSMGTIAEVMQVLPLPDGTVRVMLDGQARARIVEYLQTESFFRVLVEPVEESDERGVEVEALMRSTVAQFQQVLELGREIPPEALVQVANIEEPGRLADTVAHYLRVKVDERQKLLETLSPRDRLEKLNLILKREIEILEVQRNIRSKVEKEMGDTQREFILREQLKAIQQELGERDERTSEIEEYREKIEAAGMPDEVKERSLKELERLEKMPFVAPEGVVVRTYLDWLTSLPWSKESEETLDIPAAQAVLDEDHYGLKKVKERVLEFLAVRKLSAQMRGPILCFVGPPGVGKTSIGKSIARALGRKFIRISLGGVRDEAEIRGHRRTYIGALPGRVIQGMKTAGTRNPVFMLDEIDKLGIDFRGDPSAALLEALDPEQNNSFSDHYLEVSFDLSNVMFITTANILDPVPPALKDRMEVIPFPGYTEEEKLEIAKGFLVSKQLKENGITGEHLAFTDEAIRRIIREYTREAGVRNLEREIATVCRKVAKEVASGKMGLVQVGEEGVKSFLGPRRFHYGRAEEKDEVGVATGLVYTEFGGDIVTVEATLLKHHEPKLTLTGQLGDVMKESGMAALSYVRSRARTLIFDEDLFDRIEVHIHVPAGAVPKDGPSAGITLGTALASAATGRAVRKDVAMTGEITLRGRVLPVGGVKEKVLAAHRAGLRMVILPAENERDLEEIPEKVRSQLEFQFVNHMDEVLAFALAEPAPRVPTAYPATVRPVGTA